MAKKGSKKQGEKKGKIVLKSGISTKILAALQSKININGFRWEVVNGLFTTSKFRDILQVTQQLNINHLGLANNKNSNIINDICVFRPFDKLQTLIMPNNLIQSIQPIQYLDAPVLWRIQFSDNLIRDINSFRKMHCPNLVMFRVGGNRISDLGKIYDCFAPQLYEIAIQSNQLLINYLPLIKVPSKQFKQIYGHTTGIITNKRQTNQFKRKYPQIRIIVGSHNSHEQQ